MNQPTEFVILDRWIERQERLEVIAETKRLGRAPIPREISEWRLITRNRDLMQTPIPRPRPAAKLRAKVRKPRVRKPEVRDLVA
jgi:hypothetical protein